jgi:hypothetical protein
MRNTVDNGVRNNPQKGTPMEQPKDYKPSMSAEPNPTDALSSILSSPEAMAKIRDIAARLSSDQASPATGSSIAPFPVNSPPSDGLASVLSNPELMARLPQMMSMLAPMLSSTQAPSKGNTAKSAEDYRNDLLLALKPFLSPERCQAIDVMLRIAKLGTILRQIK